MTQQLSHSPRAQPGRARDPTVVTQRSCSALPQEGLLWADTGAERHPLDLPPPRPGPPGPLYPMAEHSGGVGPGLLPCSPSQAFPLINLLHV